MSSAHQVTCDFERAIAEYTGAPYAVAVNSCTMALLLACKWHVKKSGVRTIELPARTYVGVPMSIVHAGGNPVFRDYEWSGAYRLLPFPVWDSARWLTKDIYRILTGLSEQDAMVCLSFHATKTLGIEQGGMILHGSAEADALLRRMRFDGRTEGVDPKYDDIREIGFHCYMNPSTAAQGLMRMAALHEHNAPLPNSDYPDLSQIEAFQ